MTPSPSSPSIAQAASMVPGANYEQRLADDKGKQDYLAASDALRRLLVDIRRRGG